MVPETMEMDHSLRRALRAAFPGCQPLKLYISPGIPPGTDDIYSQNSKGAGCLRRGFESRACILRSSSLQ